MGNKLTIRTFEPSDVSRILDLHENAMRDIGAYVEGVPEEDLNAIESTYLQNGAFLIGEYDGEIVAMGGIRPVEGHLTEMLEEFDEQTAELKRLRVDPSVQGKGFGQKILNELEQCAQKRGFSEIALDTTNKQPRARQLFESSGYELEIKTDVEAFSEPMTVFVYEKLR